ncbi:phosphatase PAP2 family protein, partial [Candidatus Kaiserbacteria bacterium]|nr:phosphatase PAP2 family protein [Candidatus Kaiserbacteria bacterium]
MSLDTQLFYLLNNLAGKSQLFDGIIVFLASYLAYVLIIVFLAFVFFSQYQKREKLQILFVSVISTLIARFGVTELIRFFYHRPRPFSALDNAHQLLANGEWSFPSGHAAFFFALATAVYLYNKKWGIGFFIAAILMAAGRVAAGIHYPSDIIGGAIIGIAVACAVFYLARRISPPQAEKE